MSDSPWLAWYGNPPAGFRFSRTDALTVALGALATWATWPVLDHLALVFAIVLGHFFLFCNVFRVRRMPELVWSGLFLLNIGVWLSLGRFAWLSVLLAQTPVTLAVVLMAVLRHDYHGIGYLWVPWGRRLAGAERHHECPASTHLS